MKPDEIEIVALAAVVLPGSVTVKSPSSVTALPPPMKVANAPAVTTGTSGVTLKVKVLADGSRLTFGPLLGPLS